MIWPGAASATVVVVVPPSDVLGLFVAGVDICLVSLEYFPNSESQGQNRALASLLRSSSNRQTTIFFPYHASLLLHFVLPSFTLPP